MTVYIEHFAGAFAFFGPDCFYLWTSVHALILIFYSNNKDRKTCSKDFKSSQFISPAKFSLLNYINFDLDTVHAWLLKMINQQISNFSWAQFFFHLIILYAMVNNIISTAINPFPTTPPCTTRRKNAAIFLCRPAKFQLWPLP